MNNTYIPNSLIIIKTESNYRPTIIGYPENGEIVLCDVNEDESYLQRLIPSDIRDRFHEIAKGIIDPSIKDRVTLVPNTPFHPELSGLTLGEDGYYGTPEGIFCRFNFTWPDKKLEFTLDEYHKNKVILRLGIDKGRVIRDCVIAFDYSFRWGDRGTKVSKFPNTLYLISPSDPEYLEIEKESKEIRRFYKNGIPSVSDLVPGMFYRKKGFIDNIDGGEQNKIVVYLGEKWRIANGEHKRDPFKPGEKWTGHNMFLELKYMKPSPDGGYVPKSGNVELSSFPIDTLLHPLPDIPPLSQFEIDSLLGRFNASPFSWKFWNTPGLIKNFSVLTKDEAKKSGKVLNNSVYFDKNIVEEKIYSNDRNYITSLTTIKGTSNNCSSLYISTYRMDKEYKPVTFDISDPKKPITLTKVNKTIEEAIGNMDWVELRKSTILKDEEVPKGGVIKCCTSDGKYEFYNFPKFLLHPSMRLSLTGEGDYRSWPIADLSSSEISNLTSLRMKR